MAKPDSELETLPVETALLGDDEAPYREAAGFILLRSGGWTVERHRRLAAALRETPRPVLVANPDVSAPYPDGSFSAEPGYWAIPPRRRRRESAANGSGSRSRIAFDLALARLGAAGRWPDRVAMVGDGLCTDILGGLAAGLVAVLVTDHGLVRDLDWRAWAARTGICPDHVIPGPLTRRPAPASRKPVAGRWRGESASGAVPSGRVAGRVGSPVPGSIRGRAVLPTVMSVAASR